MSEKLLFIENASFGLEGLNTHVMCWTMAIALSNFHDRDFFFDYELPCSTPPDYASRSGYKRRFGILLKSERSLVSQLMDIPHRRIYQIDRNVKKKVTYDHLYGWFATTAEMRDRFEGNFLWDAFEAGRTPIVREDIEDNDLIEWERAALSTPAAFFFLPRVEKEKLLDSAKLRYLPEIERLAEKVVSDAGTFNAVHLRLGDFLTNYQADEYAIDRELFAKFIATTFPDKDLPVMVATDGLYEKDLFRSLFPDFNLIFIDELIFGEYRDDYLKLPFTDFNVLTILDQLVCAAAENFIGTYRSTMTAVIHRLRQERYQKRQLDFFPHKKMARFLSEDMRIVPDRSGFFDWNRYSSLAGEFRDIGWRREWDHKLTMIDV